MERIVKFSYNFLLEIEMNIFIATENVIYISDLETVGLVLSYCQIHFLEEYTCS